MGPPRDEQILNTEPVGIVQRAWDSKDDYRWKLETKSRIASWLCTPEKTAFHDAEFDASPVMRFRLEKLAYHRSEAPYRRKPQHAAVGGFAVTGIRLFALRLAPGFESALVALLDYLVRLASADGISYLLVDNDSFVRGSGRVFRPVHNDSAWLYFAEADDAASPAGELKLTRSNAERPHRESREVPRPPSPTALELVEEYLANEAIE